jgi:SAM-dependent methyltransferase
MNHWTVQVRRSIDAIETAEAEQRARRDEATAAAIVRARSRDGERATRLDAWADELAQRIPRGAAVLDLGIGADWLAVLAARGFDASAIEANSALHRDARARGLSVTLGDAAALLARVADASLDAVTFVAGLGDEKSATELIAAAHRVLKRGGCVLIAVARPDVSAEPAIGDIVASAGFGDAKRLDGIVGQALLAVRA